MAGDGKTVRCPVCDGDAYFLSASMALRPEVGKYRCSVCGHVFDKPKYNPITVETTFMIPAGFTPKSDQKDGAFAVWTFSMDVASIEKAVTLLDGLERGVQALRKAMVAERKRRMTAAEEAAG